jgi:hypothetical protein
MPTPLFPATIRFAMYPAATWPVSIVFSLPPSVISTRNLILEVDGQQLRWNSDSRPDVETAHRIRPYTTDVARDVPIAGCGSIATPQQPLATPSNHSVHARANISFMAPRQRTCAARTRASRSPLCAHRVTETVSFARAFKPA